MFHEICIYEAKVEKQDEIEALMREVAGFYREQPGVIDVKYVKRTHRQADFKAVKEGNVWTTGKSLYQATDIVGEMIRDLNLMLTDGNEEDMTFLTRVK